MVRKRKVALDKKETHSDPDSKLGMVGTHAEVRPRIYKRWVVMSSLLILLCAWMTLPQLINHTLIQRKIESLSTYILEMSLHQYLPDGKFADDIMGNLTAILTPTWLSGDYGNKASPGMVLKSQGAKAHFPVIFIPGIITTGLELWEGKECARPYFRNRLWGTLTMLKALLTDRECWLEHMRLDPETASDPAGIRIRPAQGLEAGDFIMPGYWVWARIIENLAELGYDHNNMYMASYDWRLDVANLEMRDHYFTKLKTYVEFMSRTNGKKLVIVTHSYGASIWHYFMKWAESNLRYGDIKGGGGGPTWIADHIESVVHIGGALLGTPKSLSTFTSGESRETAMLGRLESYILELFLSKSERAPLFRTWIGGFGLLPKGGNLVWGSPNATGIGVSEINHSMPFITKVLDDKSVRHVYGDDMAEYYTEFVSPKAAEIGKLYYSNGAARSQHEVERNEQEPRTWLNPLESRLPHAPGMTIYCLYGVGKETERGYVYKTVSDIRDITMVIDLDMEDLEKNIVKGCYKSDGDGTVPLLSLGFMGVRGWTKYSHLNPADVPVVVREYLHNITHAKVIDVRGGPLSGDHVDILGNHDLTFDLLRIVTNFPEHTQGGKMLLKRRVYSDIEQLSARINLLKEEEQ